jgi:hypothetical protein
MEQVNTTTIVIVILAALAIIIFVIVKNHRDRKEMNPDSTDPVEEEKTEAEQHREQM